MKTLILIYLCTLFSFYSCSNEQGVEEKKYDTNNNKIDTSKTILEPQNDIDIFSVLGKMGQKQGLIKNDYLLLSKYFLDNNSSDESLSEGIGNTLYEYFKKNETENSRFKDYLNKSKNKLQVLDALVEIMCVDLGDDNYNTKQLQDDFPIFKGEAKALKSFEQCIANGHTAD